MKSKFLPVAMLTFGLFGASGAYAASPATADVTISASITGVCLVNSTTSVAFGDLTPLITSGSAASTTGNVKFWCTNGTTAGLAANFGQNGAGTAYKLKNAAGDLIPYSLSLSATTMSGGGKNSEKTLTLTGGIANSDFANAPIGAYSDIVTVSISY